MCTWHGALSWSSWSQQSSADWCHHPERRTKEPPLWALLLLLVVESVAPCRPHTAFSPSTVNLHPLAVSLSSWVVSNWTPLPAGLTRSKPSASEHTGMLWSVYEHDVGLILFLGPILKYKITDVTTCSHVQIDRLRGVHAPDRLESKLHQSARKQIWQQRWTWVTPLSWSRSYSKYITLELNTEYLNDMNVITYGMWVYVFVFILFLFY